LKINNLYKVLIVEDSDLVSERIKEIIEEIEHTIVIGRAIDAKEALEKVEAERPDVIILDINLPGRRTGFHVLKQVKARYPSTTVAMLTNYATKQYQRRCTELGADFFFDKSNEFNDLVKIFNWV